LPWRLERGPFDPLDEMMMDLEQIIDDLVARKKALPLDSIEREIAC
jgi:hypothetical protein